jgi:GT2 family glycosyltransferase
MRSVAIVIVNYKGWRYTVECLESLGHLDYPHWYAVVVDNGSTDDSVERIRAWARGEVKVESTYVRRPGWGKPVQLEEYEGEPPEEQGVEGEAGAKLVLIRLPENRGFAGGNNVAIRYALRRGADWTWLLNNDTVVAPNALREMLRTGESDGRIAVVGCKLLYYDRPDTIQAAGGGRFYLWLGISQHYGRMR